MNITTNSKLLNIIIVTPYYFPENFKINDLSDELTRRGHKISILTPIPNYPGGNYYNGYSLIKKKYEYLNGKKIFRVPVIPRGSGSNFRLSLNYISYVLFSVFAIRKIIKYKYDLIFVYAPSPATVGLPAILLKKILKIPVIYWVHDLWPESVKSAGNLKSEFISNLLTPIIKFIYNHCDKLLVSSPGFINSIVKKGIRREKIDFFPQWAESIFKPVTSTDKKLKNLPKNSFIIMFAGNIGEAQDFESILKAASILKENKKVHWIIIGSGRKYRWVKKQIKDLGLFDSFHMLGRYPLDEMPEFYSLADAMLISLKNEHIFSLTIPAKVQSYLACGKPILAMLDGEASKIIKEAGAGIVCNSGNPDQLAKNVLKINNMNKHEIQEMGNNALNLYKKKFSRETLINKIEKLFFRISIN